MMRQPATLLPAAAVAFGLLLGACGSEPPAEAPPLTADGPTAGIDWHTGDIDLAFARAREEGKPLFLYWGADWCPPCNEIRATIFSERPFIERSRLFVPVYLDGDTERAQKLGERFGVVGYPTMIVFGAEGTELTRIPDAIDIGRYARILDLVLGDARPASGLVEALLDGRAGELDADDYRLLAYYSWSQDSGRALGDTPLWRVLDAAAEACPEAAGAEVCARLCAEALVTRLEAARAGEAKPLAAEARDAARLRVLGILADPELAASSYGLVVLHPGTVTAALTAPGTASRRELVDAFEAALTRLANDDEARLLVRLYTERARLRLARADDPELPLPPALETRILDRVAWIDREARTGYERQSLINGAWNVLNEAGLYDEARRLMTAELERSKQPYYFMLELADVARKSGRPEEAIDWLERAWEASEGPATRFQWGTNYVVGLTELAPADTGAIEATVLRVVGELERQPEPLYNRNVKRLRQLEAALLAWHAAGGDSRVLDEVRERVLALCPTGTDDAPTLCGDFLTV